MMIYHIDKLQSKMDKKTFYGNHCHNSKHRYNMRKALRKMKQRIHDMIRDFHHKVANHMCKKYDLILLPEFNTSEMVKKKNRKIKKKTVRQMQTWSHYKFKHILLHKASRYHRVIHLVREDYTSKCCSQCGFINSKLTGQKKYKCKQCDFHGDRDMNASKNILMKYMIENLNTKL